MPLAFVCSQQNTTIQKTEMEQLNSENEEFLKKIESLEKSAVTMKDATTKNSEQYNELESQLQNLRQKYDEATKIHDESTKESAAKLEAISCELESEKKKWADEKVACEKAVSDAEMERDSVAAARDELLRQLEAESKKLQLLQSEHDKQSGAMQQLNLEMEDLRCSFEEEKAAIEKKHLDQIEASTSKDGKLQSIEKDLNEANGTVSKLKEELAAAIAEKEEILSSKSDEINAKESLVSKIAQLSNSAEQWKGERVKLETSLRDLQRTSAERIQSLEKEKTELQSSLDVLKGDLYAAEGEKSKLAALENQLAVVTSSLDEANSANEALTVDHESAKKNYEEKLVSLQADIDKLAETNSALQLQNEALDAQVTWANSSSEELKESNSAVSKLKEELAAAIVEKDNALLEKSNELNVNQSLKSQIAELSDRVDQMKSERSEIETSLHDLQTSSSERIQLLEKENTNLQSSLDDLKEQMNSERTGIETSLHDLQKSTSERIELLEKENSALQSSLNEKITAAEGEEVEVSKLREELDSLRASLEEANNANEALTASQESNRTKYEGELVTLRAEINRLAEDNSTVKDAEVNKLREELDFLRASLDEANNANEALAASQESNKTKYEGELVTLRAEIDRLAAEGDTDTPTPEPTAGTLSLDELATDLAQTKEALQLLQTKFDDVQDANVTLEEAVSNTPRFLYYLLSFIFADAAFRIAKDPRHSIREGRFGG